MNPNNGDDGRQNPLRPDIFDCHECAETKNKRQSKLLALIVGLRSKIWSRLLRFSNKAQHRAMPTNSVELEDPTTTPDGV